MFSLDVICTGYVLLTKFTYTWFIFTTEKKNIRIILDVKTMKLTLAYRLYRSRDFIFVLKQILTKK